MERGRTDYDGAAVERACTSKRAIGDEKAARRSVATINAREGREAVVYYHCRHCGQFHVGRAPAR